MREFTTEAKREEVRIDGEDFVITEMTSVSQKAYMKRQGDMMKVRAVATGEQTADGRPKMRQEIEFKDLAGAQQELLAATLKRVGREGQLTPVPLDEISNWRVSLIADLAKIAQAVNRLADTDAKKMEDAEKN